MSAETADGIVTVGLMGQPNTGKSTFFNGLTGSRQHVGNWPGKTVEQKTGYAEVDGTRVSIVDLPGAYSLSANSDEERITRDFICSGAADVIVALVDASQLERSLYLLADYAGIGLPLVVALNMTDVARAKGIRVDAAELSRRLGVPVFSTVATKKEGLSELLFKARGLGGLEAPLRVQPLLDKYRTCFGKDYDRLLEALPEMGLGRRGRAWLAAKLLEGDASVRDLARSALPEDARIVVDGILGAELDGALRSADCKYSWIAEILEGVVVREDAGAPRRKVFDRIATYPVFGKILSVVMILLGFGVSMALSMPFMVAIQGVLPIASTAAAGALAGIGAPSLFVSLVSEALVPSVLMAVVMAFFIFGVALVFGFMEDVGYMARVAYNFDSLMGGLGLHGKSVMSFVMSLGCNIGGITGSRVIDSWQQRLVTIAASWVMPCGAIWGVTMLVGSLFFQGQVLWVLLAIFALALVHMKITSIVFGRVLVKDMDRTGLIMELPPYHRPNWKTIFSYVWGRIKTVFTKAFVVIVGVSVVMWILSYSPGGDISRSVIYRIGKVIQPVGMIFGLDWRLFTAFIASAMGKEAALGVFAMLYNVGGGVTSFTGTMIGSALTYDSAALSSALLSSVPKASALAFMVAFFFNVPCMAAIAATRIELRSTKWTLAIVAYYIAMALILAGVAYRVGLLIFG